MRSETATVTNTQTTLDIYQYVQSQAVKITQLISEKNSSFSFSLKKSDEDNEIKVKTKTITTAAISY